MSTKKEYFNFKTPRGAAVYPKLDRPYTFDKTKSKSFPDPDGKFEVSLALSEKDAEAFKSKIIAWAKAQGVKPEKLKNMPWKNEEDKEGEETGRVLFKFKQYGKNKDGTAKRIGHFDAKANPLVSSFKLTSGSTIIVGGSASLYKELGGGISLSVTAVQVIEYREYDVANPFGDEGDGYVGDEADDTANDNGSFDNEAAADGETASATDF